MRPFSIVEDEGFKTLMKTGLPNHYIPKRCTVARDVKQVFKKTWKRIQKMLKVRPISCKVYTTESDVLDHDRALSFATDAWTSPNHKVLVAITVHFEHEGIPISLLLDIVEVARSHSRFNLAVAFADVLNDFGIADKVSISCIM
jgi:hypothetical protein